jgi:glycosyltransferase involved in cell wall biosynthesis
VSDNSELFKHGERVLLLCLTDDPLDPPGHERFGGGHAFVFDLGRYLVRAGWLVDYITRRNSATKPLAESLGPHCSVFRVDVGPPFDVPSLELSPYFAQLTEATAAVIATRPRYDVLHSHNWLSGGVALGIPLTGIRHVHSILSLGRVRLERGEESSLGDTLRDELELKVFNSADMLLAVAPSERADLRRLYPEVQHDRITIVPYGVDATVFHPRPEPADSAVRRQAGRFTEGAI